VELDFRAFGSLEVRHNGNPVPVTARQQQVLLAVLLLHPGVVASTGALAEAVWPRDKPTAVEKRLQIQVHRLRRSLGLTGAIRYRAPGYVLDVPPDSVDLCRFADLIEQGARMAAAGEPTGASAAYGDALALWRGPAFEGFEDVGVLAAAASRLDELRLAALEGRIETDLALGRSGMLIGELTGLVAEHPLRERFRAQLMTALYRSGRSAEALAVYRDARRLLHDELGIEPGPECQALHQLILRNEPLPLGPPPLAGPGQPGPPPGQLPPAVGPFVGRTAELDQMDAGLSQDDTPALIAVTGIGGIGKTALALHWAHRVRRRFPDGQLFIDLRGYALDPPVRPIEALARFLHALGVPPEQVPADVDEAAAMYRSLLADRTMLVLLDNAYDADQVRPLLAGGASATVVTSRDVLGGLVAREGARLLNVDVLSASEADALLRRLLGANRVARESEAAGALAELCAFLPLALRIAAAQLAAAPWDTFGRYADELRRGDRLALLRVDGDELTGVRVAFDLSYTRQPPDARRLLRLLAAAPGQHVTIEVAAALADTSVAEASRLLRGLASAHLVEQPAADRFVLHDLVRLYAAERADADEPAHTRQAAVGRLMNHLLARVDAAAASLYPEKLRLPDPDGPPDRVPFADATAAMAWLDGERGNLVAAVTHAAAHGPRPAAYRLADALRGYFWLRLHAVDWRTVAEAGLAAATAEDDTQGRAAAMLSLADLDMLHERRPEAIDNYQRALRLCREVEWLEGQSAALGNLGNVYWRSGRLEEAAAKYAEGLELDRAIGWVAGQSVKLGNLANVYRSLGRLADAADLHLQALALDRLCGSRNGEAVELCDLAEVRHARGEFAEALLLLDQALRLQREVGDRVSEAETLRVLAAVRRDLGNPALDLATVALDLARDTGERRVEADALQTLGSIHDRLDADIEAADCYRSAVQLAREVDNRYTEAEALIGLGALHTRQGDAAAAVACVRPALATAKACRYRILEGNALTVLARIRLLQDRPVDAIRDARAAAAIHRQTGHRPGLAAALHALARATRLAGATGAPREYGAAVSCVEPA
jgi:DNA-binding SARP family transcriptional activator/tetratricopeptide (TPR) repeat protein